MTNQGGEIVLSSRPSRLPIVGRLKVFQHPRLTLVVVDPSSIGRGLVDLTDTLLEQGAIRSSTGRGCRGSYQGRIVLSARRLLLGLGLLNVITMLCEIVANLGPCERLATVELDRTAISIDDGVAWLWSWRLESRRLLAVEFQRRNELVLIGEIDSIVIGETNEVMSPGALRGSGQEGNVSIRRGRRRRRGRGPLLLDRCCGSSPRRAWFLFGCYWTSRHDGEDVDGDDSQAKEM